MTVTEFLLARIAEVETVARSVQEVAPKSAAPVFTSLDKPTGTVEMSPARVLAECEAKRRIVERADRMTDEDAFAQIGWELLGRLALPYADHTDYRPEWRA